MKDVESGRWFTIALRDDGTVWIWGWLACVDSYGCDEFAGPTLTETPNSTAIAAGEDHVLAIKIDGTVWAWGDDRFGQLGDGDETGSRAPVQVLGLSDTIAIAAGESHSLAIKDDGSVWTWGKNDQGQLGDGTTTDRDSPVRVRGLTNVVAIAAGESHSLAITDDGSVWAWGSVDKGKKLGDGTTIDRDSPVQVIGITNAFAVAAGANHSLAVTDDGSVWAWGNNDQGQLGDGTTIDRDSPVQVIGITNAFAVAAGTLHSLALVGDGDVWAWGTNYASQIGDNSYYGIKESPVRVPGLQGIAAISAGNIHTVALANDGVVWAWGGNIDGQLGPKTPVDYQFPRPSSDESGPTIPFPTPVHEIEDPSLTVRVLSWAPRFFCILSSVNILALGAITIISRRNSRT